MAQFMVELLEEQPLTGMPLERAYSTNKMANEELDFSKTVKPENLRSCALAKARIPKQQQNLLKKRTDKIEVQTGAAIAKQKTQSRREVFLQPKRKKDLADALTLPNAYSSCFKWVSTTLRLS
jgi:hypothetical protein